MADLERLQEMPHHVSVMVIEDDAMVRSIIVEYLQTFGFTRITAPTDSSKAIVMLLDEKLPYDLVLSDWHMPDVNGLDVLKLCKKLSHRKNMKFIMITSQVAEEKNKIMRARAEGADAYIIKPFKGRLLHEKIWSVLGWAPRAKTA